MVQQASSGGRSARRDASYDPRVVDPRTFNPFALITDSIIDQPHMNGIPADEIWEWAPMKPREFIMSENGLNLADAARECHVRDIEELIGDDPIRRTYDEGVFCEAIGNGKSFKLSCLAAYFTHVLLCMREPQRLPELFGHKRLAPNSKIAIINMSVSATNATKVVFGEIKSKIDNSPWFQKYYPPNPRVRSELQFDPSPNEPETVEVDGKKMMRRYKNVYIIPGSSTEYSAVGYNLFLGIMDEATLYRSTDREDTADTVFDALNRRITSRFPGCGMLVMGGSPMYTEDFLERKQVEAIKDKRIFAVRRSAWEAKNPDWQGNVFHFDTENLIVVDDPFLKTQQGVITIPQIYENDFRKNPEKAWRDLGARPTAAISRFYENTRLIEDMANKRREDPISVRGTMKHWFGPISQNWHTVHADLALTGDALGLALGHIATYNAKGEPIFWIDLMLRIEGSQENPIEIARVREWIRSWKRIGFNIGLITFDGFQSADSIQILNKEGFTAEYLSVDRTMGPHTDLKEAINTGRIDYYVQPYLLKELKELERIKNKKIDHPPGGCFAAGTHVELANGAIVAIERLAGIETFVRAITSDGRPTIARARGRWTKLTRDLVDVMLSNRAIVRCTPDHRFRLHDGTYVEAHSLTPVMRLSSVPQLTTRDRTLELAVQRAKTRQQAQALMAEWDMRLAQDAHRAPLTVVAVQPAEVLNPVSVYDLEVDEHHNFALYAGCFVHNSKDVADAVAGVVHNLTRLAPREDRQQDVQIRVF